MTTTAPDRGVTSKPQTTGTGATGRVVLWVGAAAAAVVLFVAGGAVLGEGSGDQEGGAADPRGAAVDGAENGAPEAAAAGGDSDGNDGMAVEGETYATFQDPDYKTVDGNFVVTEHLNDGTSARTVTTFDGVNPYAVRSTVMTDDTGTVYGEEGYTESPDVPLAAVNSPIWEEYTGVAYEDFQAHMEQLTPGDDSEPFTSQDILDSLTARMTVAYRGIDGQHMDPRAVSSFAVEGSQYADDTHGFLKDYRDSEALPDTFTFESILVTDAAGNLHGNLSEEDDRELIASVEPGETVGVRAYFYIDGEEMNPKNITLQRGSDDVYRVVSMETFGSNS